ncbi:ATP-binding protein [Streptomyces sp. NPDC051567]|uniref:ATP-binding protein n=1 Tax=Streptomyces sp. NPDC051567 TaxID=3365660 RepID=UPI0037AB9FD0
MGPGQHFVNAAPIGPPCYQAQYPNEPAALAKVRADIGLYLGTWGLECLVDDAQLAATEIVANAIQHTGTGEIGVDVTWTGAQRVRITVTDDSPVLPRTGAGDLLAESRRGLVLVQALTRAWGSRAAGTGKQVWADLELG